MEKVVFAFSALGKSYLKENEKKFGIKVVDNDVMYYDRRDPEFVNKYVDKIIEHFNNPDIDLVLNNINLDVIKELVKRGYKCSVITPIWISSPDELELIKQIIFGRLVLRKEQTSKNVGWLERMKSSFNERTNIKQFEIDGVEILKITLDKLYLTDFI